MNKVKKALLSSAAVIALVISSLAAFGADLPADAPAMAPIAFYDWTGCYIGGHLGGAFRSDTITNRLGASTHGRHRVIPVYLDGPLTVVENTIYGTFNFQAIDTRKEGGMAQVAARITTVLAGEDPPAGRSNLSTTTGHPLLKLRTRLRACAQDIAGRFSAGGRLLAFGNGGSSTDAQEMATLFLHPGDGMRALPSFCLSNDTAVVTALCNDIGVEVVFARQVAAFGGRPTSPWRCPPAATPRTCCGA